jgi:hypothetical protein
VLVQRSWHSRGIDPNAFIVAHPARLTLLAKSRRHGRLPTSCSHSTPRTRIGLRHPRSDIEHAACTWPIVARCGPVPTVNASPSISFVHSLSRSVKQHGVASPNNRNIRLRLNQTCDARHEWSGPGLQFASLLARRPSRGRWLSLARMQSSGPTRGGVWRRSNACD